MGSAHAKPGEEVLGPERKMVLSFRRAELLKSSQGAPTELTDHREGRGVTSPPGPTWGVLSCLREKVWVGHN